VLLRERRALRLENRVRPLRVDENSLVGRRHVLIARVRGVSLREDPLDLARREATRQTRRSQER
jgi:hypothetical protein